MCMALLCACGKQTAVEKALDEAGDNRLELLKVIDHYRNGEGRDSLKLEAAMFLIGNMPGHGSVWSEAIDTFRQELCRKDIAWGMEAMNKTWDALKANDKPVFRKDLNHVKADFLIEDIDKAFQTWQHRHGKRKWTLNSSATICCLTVSRRNSWRRAGGTACIRNFLRW